MPASSTAINNSAGAVSIGHQRRQAGNRERGAEGPRYAVVPGLQEYIKLLRMVEPEEDKQQEKLKASGWKSVSTISVSAGSLDTTTPGSLLGNTLMEQLYIASNILPVDEKTASLLKKDAEIRLRFAWLPLPFKAEEVRAPSVASVIKGTADSELMDIRLKSGKRILSPIGKLFAPSKDTLYVFGLQIRVNNSAEATLQVAREGDGVAGAAVAQLPDGSAWAPGFTLSPTMALSEDIQRLAKALGLSNDEALKAIEGATVFIDRIGSSEVFVLGASSAAITGLLGVKSIKAVVRDGELLVKVVFVSAEEAYVEALPEKMLVRVAAKDDASAIQALVAAAPLLLAAYRAKDKEGIDPSKLSYEVNKIYEAVVKSINDLMVDASGSIIRVKVTDKSGKKVVEPYDGPEEDKIAINYRGEGDTSKLLAGFVAAHVMPSLVAATTIPAALLLEAVEKSYGVIETAEKPAAKESAREETLMESEELRKVTEKVLQVSRVLSKITGLQDSAAALALMVAAIQGSSPVEPPFLVHLVGPPGTGKTSSALALAEMIRIPKIRVTMKVSRRYLTEIGFEKAVREAAESLRSKLSLLVSDEDADRLTTAFRNILMKTGPRLVTENPKEFADFVHELLSEVAGDLPVRSSMLKSAVRSSIYSLVNVLKKTRSDRKLLSTASDVRRTLLETLAQVGLIQSPEEKLDFNAGTVKWFAKKSSSSITVGVDIDLHYALAKLGPSGVERLVKLLHGIGAEVDIVEERGRKSVVSLSKVQDLDSLQRVAAEDPLERGRYFYRGTDMRESPVVVIDEPMRDKEVLSRLLTETSVPPMDSSRAGAVILADNIEPLMEFEAEPDTEASLSRIAATVYIPKWPRDARLVAEGFEEEKRLALDPPLTMPELLALKKLSERVVVPDTLYDAATALSIFTTYRVMVKRTDYRRDVDSEPFKILPRGKEVDESILNLYKEAMPLPEGVRLAKDARIWFHVARIAQTLAAMRGEARAQGEDIRMAAMLTLPARVIPDASLPPEEYMEMKLMVAHGLASKLVEAVYGLDSLSVRTIIEKAEAGAEITPSEVEAFMREARSNPIILLAVVNKLMSIATRDPAKFEKATSRVPGFARAILNSIPVH